MTIYTAYDEIAEVLSTAEPVKLAKLRASAEMQARLEFLIEKSKEGELSKSEKDELPIKAYLCFQYTISYGQHR